MADAPKKARKAQGPRTPKPIFAVVAYTDESGNEMKLDKSRLKIVLERDSAKIVDLITSDDGFGNVAVVRVDLPVAATRKPAEAPATS